MNEEKKQERGCLFYGCATGLCLVAIGISGVVTVYLYGRSEVGPYCDRYLDLTKQAKYQEAYQLLAPAWKDKESFEEYAEFEKRIRTHIGILRTKTIVNVGIQTNRGVSTAKIGYNAAFSKSQNCGITFTLVKMGETWLVQQLNYNSSELDQSGICPTCQQKVNMIIVTFCPKCGTKIENAK